MWYYSLLLSGFIGRSEKNRCFHYHRSLETEFLFGFWTINRVSGSAQAQKEGIKNNVFEEKSSLVSWHWNSNLIFKDTFYMFPCSFM